MKQTTTVNKFEVSFYDDGYPIWAEIKYEDNVVLRLHHAELKDLEYALNRTIYILKNKLPAGSKWEA